MQLKRSKGRGRLHQVGPDGHANGRWDVFKLSQNYRSGALLRPRREGYRLNRKPSSAHRRKRSCEARVGTRNPIRILYVVKVRSYFPDPHLPRATIPQQIGICGDFLGLL